MSDHMSEEWRDVVGADGLVKVSNFGRILRLKRHSRTGRKGNTGIPFTPKPPKNRVWITGRGSIHVAILVLEAFVGLCPDGMECCHYDDNQTNNKLSNLRWDTHANNVRDGYRNGAKRGKEGNRGRKKVLRFP